MTLAPSQFVLRRLRGQTPFERAFWWDMLLVGTTINLAVGALAVATYLHGAPMWLAAAVFLSPLPWNGLLATSVWRAAGNRPDPQRALARAAALVWLMLMVLV